MIFTYTDKVRTCQLTRRISHLEIDRKYGVSNRISAIHCKAQTARARRYDRLAAKFKHVRNHEPSQFSLATNAKFS